jgi:uncharacterized membrane protein YeiH
VAIEEGLDILGILILGGITAVGGGMTRDILLGNTPPAMFTNPIYCLIAIFTVSTVIITYKRIAPCLKEKQYTKLIQVIHLLDAMGLGIFTVVGADIAIGRGFGDNLFLCSFVGVVTGVGGGLLRDVLANRTPVILKKDIYAVASILGAILYCYIIQYLPHRVAVIIATVLIVLIRLVAVYKNIHLPAISKITLPKLQDKLEQEKIDEAGVPPEK